MLKNLWTAKRYLRKYKGRLMLGAFFLLLTDAFQLALPQIIRAGINALKTIRDTGTLDRIVGGFGPFKAFVDLSRYTPQLGISLLVAAILIAGLSRGITHYVFRILMFSNARKFENDLRVDYFNHIIRLPASFHDRTKTGDLMARGTNDLAAVRMATGMGILIVCDVIFLLTGGLALMFWTNSALTLKALAPLAILPILTCLFGRPIKRRFEKIQSKFSDISAVCQENYSGARVIKAFVREQSERDKFRAINRDYAAKNVALAKLRSLFRPLLFCIANVSMVIVYWLGSSSVMAGEMQIGDLYAMQEYVVILFWPMIAIGWAVVILGQADASMKRINQIMDEAPTIVDAPDAVPLQNPRGEIELRNLNFTYKGSSTPALSNINLRIPAAGTLAIVGPPGSGKSTLARLIARLYEVGEGQLFIDGQDVTRIKLDDLRQAIGFVPQETFLFSESIIENIKYGAPDADEDALRRAIKIAHLDADMASFPDGSEQLLGERGINLSGGQKQRVTIARAIIRNPRILILDDALSSVDTDTEEQIMRGLRAVMQNCTSIVISHRMGGIRFAQNIVVLKDGEIIEQGRHDDLMRLGGFYAETFRRQQLEESLDQTD